MSTVNVCGETRNYPENTTLQQIARDFQERYTSEIVLAVHNGKLRELHHTIHDGGELSFVTIADKAGNSTYERSVIFLMVKAFLDVARNLLKYFYVDFSISNGVYCCLKGRKIDEETIAKIENRMQELVKEDIPFEKDSVATSQAVRIFRQLGLKDKADLFEFRRASETRLYHLDNCIDYYYAYLVPSTGYLIRFKLTPYHEGFLLQTPRTSNPHVIEPFKPQEKLFRTLLESAKWHDKLGLSTVGSLNNRIVEGGAEELMLLQEAFLEKKIGDVAEEIAKSGKKIVMIAGPSSSGKTTFSIRLSIQLMAQGLRPHPIACDDFFRNRADYPIDPETGEADFEALDCVDREFLTETLERLLRGEKVDLPTYNFTVGEREFRGKTLKLGPEDVIILEGIHCLNDALTPGIEADRKYRIYISALQQLNIDEHNRIPTTDGRLLRRIVRDAKTRGYSAQDTISRWDSVRRGEEKNIFPYQESCDVMVNSALIYELSVLKPYAEPLLYSVPKTSPEYVEAKRLLKFLDYFLAIPSEQVPKNSIMREFIGGSLFDV